ncbi:MAG: hypothetical protein FWH35_10475 [Treponema sp.]|nr:hypothetical protein [Treponema sp.]
MLYRKEEKAMLLKNWKRSGKTAWAYAKENGICPQTFARWKKARKATQKLFTDKSKKFLYVFPPLRDKIWRD